MSIGGMMKTIHKTLMMFSAGALLGAAILHFVPYHRHGGRTHTRATPRPTFVLAREVTYFEDRVRRSPGSFQTRAQLSSLYAKQARLYGDPALYDLAEATARKSLAIFPSPNPVARLTLAQVEEARHQFGRAITIAREVERESTSPVGSGSVLVTSYLAQGELLQASREADKLVEAKPSLGTYALRALVMAAMGRPTDAFEDFENALRVEDYGEQEESAWVRALYARELMRGGRYNYAQRQLEASLASAPGYHLALNYQGELALRKGDTAAAEELFRQAFTGSKQVTYLARMAAARVRAGDRAGGLVLLKEAEDLIRSELKSGGYGHRLELAKILLFRADLEKGPGLELLEESKALASKELEIRRTTDVMWTLATVTLRLDDPSHAADFIREAIRSGTSDPEVFYEASLIERKLNDEHRARFFARRALETNPSFSPERSIDL
jgi:tetratricopeptide (TPR) repeat protein